jgi:hypothetical protein
MWMEDGVHKWLRAREREYSKHLSKTDSLIHAKINIPNTENFNTCSFLTLYKPSSSHFNIEDGDTTVLWYVGTAKMLNGTNQETNIYFHNTVIISMHSGHLNHQHTPIMPQKILLWEYPYWKIVGKGTLEARHSPPTCTTSCLSVLHNNNSQYLSNLMNAESLSSSKSTSFSSSSWMRLCSC